MSDRAIPSSKLPLPAANPLAASPALRDGETQFLERMRIEGSGSPVAGRATASTPVLSEPPENNPDEIARYNNDIEFAEDIPSLQSIWHKLRAVDSVMNAEKHILVAKCFIRIGELADPNITTEVLSSPEAVREIPLENFKKALQLLETHPPKPQEKLRLLETMVRLYDRIKLGSPNEIREEKTNCQVMAYTARIALINHFIHTPPYDFSSAGEHLSSFIKLPEGALTPGQEIALIPIAYLMMLDAHGSDRKIELDTFTGRTAIEALAHIRGLKDPNAQVKGLKSLMQELEKILKPTNSSFSGPIKRHLEETLSLAKRELRKLEPKPKISLLAITLLALGALALLGVYQGYRRWSRA